MQTENKTDGTEMFNQTAAENQPAKEQTTEAPVESKKEQTPIYLGGKKFNSVEELAEYTQQLEASKYTQPTQAYQPQPASTEKPLSELIFEDPEKALQLHEQRVIQKLKAEEDQKSRERNFWDSFYKENKDLSDQQEVVQFAMNKHWDELSRLHPEQAQKKIADYTRKTILKFKGTSETTKELPSGVAKAGPSNTQSAPTVTESRPAAVDFVTQLRKIQSKRR